MHKDHRSSIGDDVSEHPAVRMWCELDRSHALPESIAVLKDRQKESQKSSVYRLDGVGRHGGGVIAKRCWRVTAMLERSIYETILPRLTVTAPHYYGFVEEQTDENCWLFLEDVEGEAFSSSMPRHRVLAGEWLGTLHAQAADLQSASDLPKHDASFYFGQMQVARDKILSSLANPALGNDAVTVLHRVLAHFETLERHWSEIENRLSDMPRTLIHGDFKGGNMFVREGTDGSSLLPFDWERSGWGVPAVDVAQNSTAWGKFSASPDVPAYWKTVRGRWPDIEIDAIRKLARVGTLFRLILAIEWATQRLTLDWPRRAMTLIDVYESRLAESIPGAVSDSGV